MVFQKKIIIGSIMSFIATAIGIVAIFFPDLLNLQKEKMDKLDIFIQSPKDIRKLTSFLHKNSGRIVDLNIAYCLENEDNSPSLVSVDTRNNRLTLEEYYEIDGSNLRPAIEVVIDKNERAPAYFWRLGLSDYPLELARRCKVEGPIYRGELLSGIFVAEIQSFNAYQYLIFLEPLSKKDLKLKNY